MTFLTDLVDRGLVFAYRELDFPLAGEHDLVVTELERLVSSRS